jgi:hypothetical protein
LFTQNRHGMKSAKNYLNPQSLSRMCILLFIAVALIFLYLRTFLLPATPFLTFGDEAQHYLNALRMLRGQLPFRDFFIFVLPGTDLMYAGILRVFGVHQWMMQGLLIILGLLISVIVLWVSSSVLRGRSVILPGLLFLVFDFDSALDANHHWWSVLFVMAATGVLLGGRGRGRISSVGALCGVATIFTQTHGALSLVAFALYLFLAGRSVDEKRSLLHELSLLFLSFAAIVVPAVGCLAILVGFSSMIYWTIYYPLAYFSVKGDTPLVFFKPPTFHGLKDLFALLPYTVIHVVVPLIYLLCIFRILREGGELDFQTRRKVLLLALVGLALFASIMSTPTFLRLCVVAPPAMVLCVWFLDRPTRLFCGMSRVLWAVTLLLLLYLPASRQLHKSPTADLPTGHVAFFNSKQYERTWWLAQHTRPGESFFDEPAVAVALSLESPGPIDYVRPNGFTRPEHIHSLLKSMTVHHTRYVFLYSELTEPFRPKDTLEPFWQYLAANYHLAKTVTGGEIWERN